MPTIEQKKMAPVKDYDNLPSTLRLSKTMLQKWPELSNARLYLGFGDGAMANIGSKCTNIERVAVTVGTSAALRVVVPTTEMNDTPLPSGLWCYSIDKEHSLLGGALTDGGSVHEFLNQIIPISTEEISSSNSTSIPVKDHHDDLVVLPFLSGERSPGWNDHARATIHGINRYTTKSDIRLAMYESVCLRLCSVFNLMLPYLDHSLKNIVVIASGTALKSNPMWKQMMADSLGTQLIVENVSEATSRGVALMIIKSLQKKDTIVNEMLNEKSEVWKSNEANHVQYEKKLLKQEKLYTSLYSDSNVNRGKSGSRSHNVSLIGAAMICGVVIGFTISQLRNSAR
jgi:gluconokinase